MRTSSVKWDRAVRTPEYLCAGLDPHAAPHALCRVLSADGRRCSFSHVVLLRVARRLEGLARVLSYRLWPSHLGVPHEPFDHRTAALAAPRRHLLQTRDGVRREGQMNQGAFAGGQATTPR